jgi:UDP-N-acetylglucosamine--N-acetylmuramyl-(pentapeptide) pyrophosphoryl-undecaprenol N-acetylglucosamine transferase
MSTRADILIFAGGTGGHVMPALAVAEELRRAGRAVVWVGTRAGLEARLVPAAGIEMEWIAAAGLRGKGVARWLGAPLLLARACLEVLAILRRRAPRAVLGFGGYVSGPGGLMAWLTRRRLLIHEQNAVAGLTNRVLSRLAWRVLEAFPGALPTPRTHATGNPVRAAIAALPQPQQRLAGRSGPLRLLVVGGSQGALFFNHSLPAALALLPAPDRPEVWHQCGRDAQAACEAAYAAAGVSARIAPFIEDMAAAYAWSDVVLCRSGALTVAELAAAGCAALLVPFPAAVDDHQTANGRYLETRGAAVLLPQAGVTASSLAGWLARLAADRPALLAMASAARAAAQPQAAQMVARHCLEALEATP